MLFTSITVITLISSLAGIYRLFIGPTVTDRIIGLDLLFAIAVLFCLLSAWVNQNSLYLDVAIGIALTGFIATLSWAKLLQTSQQNRAKAEEE